MVKSKTCRLSFAIFGSEGNSKGKVSGVENFVLGGVIIPEALWHVIEAEFAFHKKYFGVSGEVKWRYFSPQKTCAKSNSLTHLTGVQKEQFRLSLYQMLIKFDAIHLISIVVDVALAYQLKSIQSENDLYWQAYQQIMAYFQKYLSGVSSRIGNKTNGMIICDHRQPKDDRQLQVLHHRFLTAMHAENFEKRYLIEGVFVAPSHLSLGIQLADIVGGAVYRKFVRHDARYFDLIAPLFIAQEGESSLIIWPVEEKKERRRVGEPVPADIDAVTAHV